MTVTLSTFDFDETLASADRPVLVDFTASWCGPCRALGPVIDELASERTDIDVVKVDVDASQPLSARYGVQGVPTLILFKDGEIVWRATGAKSKATLETELASVLA